VAKTALIVVDRGLIQLLTTALNAQEEIDRIVLAGQVTEQCILYSALDAYIRHVDVAVPRDAVAHIFEDLAEASLTLMERNMHAAVCDAGECRLGERH
jgi:nicotinamidase-related amidase